MVDLKRPASIIAFFVLVALVVPGLCSAASTQEPGPPAGCRECLVQEPVFKGEAYIVEAGMDRSLSVVLVHGLGDRGARDWDSLIPLLAEHYHVVAFDLPGFGRSSKQNALYSPERYAAFVQWAITRFVKGNYVLIGHSFGGAVALRYAADRPTGLKKLILADVAGVLHRIALAKTLVPMRPREAAEGFTAAPREKVHKLARLMLDSMERERVSAGLDVILGNPALRQTMLNAEPGKIATLALLLDDLTEAIDSVSAPTLVLWGRHDTVAPLRTGKVLAGHMPLARLEIIEGAAHVPMLEQTDRFANAVLREIAADAPQKIGPVPDLQAAHTAGNGICEHENGRRFTGTYRMIVIHDCKEVRIEDARAGLVDVTDSEVVIENSRISGSDTSLKAEGSELVLTNVTIEGNVAIQTSNSRLDLAGVKLIGRTAAVVAAKNDSTLVFSVSRIESPHTTGPIHGPRTVSKGRPL